MRISPLTECDGQFLETLARNIEICEVQIHITTTELSYALGVSQDTIKRRLNRERDRFNVTKDFAWDDEHLPEPTGTRWRVRPAEWDLVVVLRWLAQRPMRRQV